MKAEKIISKLNSKGISFSIEHFYNEYNTELFFTHKGMIYECDITNGTCNGFIDEKGKVYSNLKHILK
ncbi:hypothetical protein UFOVP603_41 [uncultured Caudovirales phage]|uniref:Uncharacterized protein n=1 Tax=uncultured Caudovirales phage TaxID=2100421 RepID=A0A6J5N4W4_9CAUD|nr:hypothetical protein UFOVP603_41 [uncultured Caudovirales phage]